MSGIARPIDHVAPRVGRARRWRLPVVSLALAWLGIVGVLMIAGGQLAPHDPGTQDLLVGLSGPGEGHLLGTDELGRDILSRVMAGARAPVLGGLVIAVSAMVISATFGLIAGYLGGVTEAVIMRATDLLMALPGLLVTLVVVAAFGGGYLMPVLLLALLCAPPDVRMVRSVTLEQRPRAYVEAARVMGLSSRRIMTSHLLPNVMPLIVVNLCVDFTAGLLTLAGLTFLGVGVGPGAVDWGRMLFENRGFLTFNAWAALAPAVMILLTAAAANVVGDWIYDRVEAAGKAR
jgi:peptide/nickel transport system permease protein